MKWKYDNPTYRNKDDCSIRAFSKVLDKPYVDVKKELLQTKRLNRIEYYYYLDNLEKYIKINKLKEIKLKQEMTVEEFGDANEGSYIILVSEHMVGIVNGILYDNWDSRKEKIIKVWKKIKKVKP
jgi:hypothetical protein